MSGFTNLPDELLLGHVVPALGRADQFLLSCVDRRTRALAEPVKRGTRRGYYRPFWRHFVASIARLRWARENGCQWDGWISSFVASGGCLEVLKWARAQDPPCPWDEKTCTRAARGGHLEMLI